MRSTGSLPETDTVPNRSAGYMRRNDAWVANTDTLPWSGTSAGGGYSTVGDFFRFAEALQSGTLISKASFAQMTTPIDGSTASACSSGARGRRAASDTVAARPVRTATCASFPNPATSWWCSATTIRRPHRGWPTSSRCDCRWRHHRHRSNPGRRRRLRVGIARRMDHRQAAAPATGSSIRTASRHPIRNRAIRSCRLTCRIRHRESSARSPITNGRARAFSIAI